MALSSHVQKYADTLVATAALTGAAAPVTTLSSLVKGAPKSRPFDAAVSEWNRALEEDDAQPVLTEAQREERAKAHMQEFFRSMERAGAKGELSPVETYVSEVFKKRDEFLAKAKDPKNPEAAEYKSFKRDMDEILKDNPLWSRMRSVVEEEKSAIKEAGDDPDRRKAARDKSTAKFKALLQETLNNPASHNDMTKIVDAMGNHPTGRKLGALNGQERDDLYNREVEYRISKEHAHASLPKGLTPEMAAQLNLDTPGQPRFAVAEANSALKIPGSGGGAKRGGTELPQFF